MPAEIAYFFRVPLLRDAAYQLQVPSDRARLHRFALEITETMFGGRPPEPQPDQWGDLKCEPHTTDPYALDLAEHARGVRIWAGDDDPDTFRIKIWTEDGLGDETIVYDNKRDQAIGAGSIIIHTKKK